MTKSSRVPLEQNPRSFPFIQTAPAWAGAAAGHFYSILSVLPGCICPLHKEFQIISELQSPKQTWEIPGDSRVPVFRASLLKPGFSALLCLRAAFLFKDFINTAKLILITVIIQLY